MSSYLNLSYRHTNRTLFCSVCNRKIEKKTEKVVHAWSSKIMIQLYICSNCVDEMFNLTQLIEENSNAI